MEEKGELKSIMDKKIISLQLPDDLIKKIKNKADLQCLSMSAAIRIALLEWVKKGG